MRQDAQDYAGNSIRKIAEESDELTTEETQKVLDAGVALAIIQTRSTLEKHLLATKNVGQTQNIVKQVLNDVLSGPRKTGGSNVHTTENGTEKTGNMPLQKSRPADIERTHQNSLDLRLENSELEKLGSMSLVDSSMKVLHDCLKKLVDEKTHTTERIIPIDTHRVQAAVKCADQIGKLMKIKLDAFKTLRGDK